MTRMDQVREAVSVLWQAVVLVVRNWRALVVPLAVATLVIAGGGYGLLVSTRQLSALGVPALVPLLAWMAAAAVALVPAWLAGWRAAARLDASLPAGWPRRLAVNLVKITALFFAVGFVASFLVSFFLEWETLGTRFLAFLLAILGFLFAVLVKSRFLMTLPAAMAGAQGPMAASDTAAVARPWRLFATAFFFVLASMFTGFPDLQVESWPGRYTLLANLAVFSVPAVLLVAWEAAVSVLYWNMVGSEETSTRGEAGAVDPNRHSEGQNPTPDPQA